MNFIYFFIIGAFAGWLLECFFKFVTQNFKRTPGILNTPFCILYGVGTVLLSFVVSKITDNFLLLFFLSMLILTVIEYITFILLNKIYDLQLWDYSDMEFKINEKVCLEFSVIWGILGALYIKYLLPILNNIYLIYNKEVFNVILIVIMCIIVIDFVISSTLLIKKKILKTVEK